MRSLALAIMLSAWALTCRADEEFPVAQCMATIEAVFEAVLDHHVNPPTRQEMSLALLRHLNSDQSAPALALLSRTVSDISSKQELAELVQRQVAASHDRLHFHPDRLSELDLSWLESVVHGGVRLDSVQNADVQQQLAANRYVGIGVQLGKDKDCFIFRRVLENGSAARGGLCDNDVLLKVNDQPIEGTISDVIDQLRGPQGTRLRLTVKSGDDAPRDIDLVRQVVFMKTVTLEPLKPKETSATINIETVKASSVHELQTILENLPSYVREIRLRIRGEGNFHYLHLLADALMDETPLGTLVMRDGIRTITTSSGNILGGRKLRVEVTDTAGPQQILSFLMLRGAMDLEETQRVFASTGAYLGQNAPRPKADTPRSEQVMYDPVYLQESFPILNGQAVISLATRRFESGTGE